MPKTGAITIASSSIFKPDNLFYTHCVLNKYYWLWWHTVAIALTVDLGSFFVEHNTHQYLWPLCGLGRADVHIQGLINSFYRTYQQVIHQSRWIYAGSISFLYNWQTNDRVIFTNSKMEEQKTQDKSKLMLWLKRFGIWGFLFFLIKGLVWVGIFIYGYFWATKK